MIPVEPDPEGVPFERCCKCRAPATHWSLLPDRLPGEQVGLCLACARTYEPDQIPSKQAWCNAELARMPKRSYT